MTVTPALYGHCARGAPRTPQGPRGQYNPSQPRGSAYESGVGGLTWSYSAQLRRGTSKGGCVWCGVKACVCALSPYAAALLERCVAHARSAGARPRSGLARTRSSPHRSWCCSCGAGGGGCPIAWTRSKCSQEWTGRLSRCPRAFQSSGGQDSACSGAAGATRGQELVGAATI